jgi:hypothetical protein
LQPWMVEALCFGTACGLWDFVWEDWPLLGAGRNEARRMYVFVCVGSSGRLGIWIMVAGGRGPGARELWRRTAVESFRTQQCSSGWRSLFGWSGEHCWLLPAAFARRVRSSQRLGSDAATLWLEIFGYWLEGDFGRTSRERSAGRPCAFEPLVTCLHVWQVWPLTQDLNGLYLAGDSPLCPCLSCLSIVGVCAGEPLLALVPRAPRPHPQ